MLASLREIKGEKILVTGGQGASGFPVARDLAKDNEVHVMARFGDPRGREKLSAVGVIAFSTTWRNRSTISMMISHMSTIPRSRV